jgi:hypothetical protein
VKDKEVFKFVGERIHATPSPSCRYYYHGQKWKQAGLNWKKMIEGLMKPSGSKAMIVQEIDAKFTTSKDRVAEWKRQTGMSAQSYWATRRAVNIRHGVRTKRSKEISDGMRRRHANRQLGLPPARPDRSPQAALPAPAAT